MNYIEIESGTNVPIKAWVKGVEFEERAKQQIINVSTLDFVGPHIAVMPDVHWGMGCTVGSVVPTYNALIPAAVGVDIGCGMMAVKTTLTASDLPENLLELRLEIEKNVPHGRTNNGKVGDRGAWGNLPADISFDQIGLNKLIDKHPSLSQAAKRAPYHMGTLGTGNHFIEVCLDEKQFVWVMLHSGSRGIGNRIGTYFIEIAKNEMIKQGITLPDNDLAYLKDDTEFFYDYVNAVSWAQDFAKLNRQYMMRSTLNSIINIIKKPFQIVNQAINCHHNYVRKEFRFSKDLWITRKGAVYAGYGELGIIPGSMGAKSYIVKGKGNPMSFESCSHGAGRKMSRGDAKKKFTIEDHEKATLNVECRKDQDVIDETPGAYKDIDSVIEAQSDLIEVVETLKQVLCVKG